MNDGDTKLLLGARIKELRKKNAISQEELAEACGISSKYLSRIELGMHFPSIEILLRLSEKLGVEIKDLFDFLPEPSTREDLKKTLDELVKGIDEKLLRLVVKVVRAMVR
ncbi:MAG TPA: XRE family transcriptional regulator [Deltaproteobacteria bacterium]|nr:XRE family transcriptional regulator [Deltaproteobacteria bacterium]